jgi:hypothetical protein
VKKRLAQAGVFFTQPLENSRRPNKFGGSALAVVANLSLRALRQALGGSVSAEVTVRVPAERAGGGPCLLGAAAGYLRAVLAAPSLLLLRRDAHPVQAELPIRVLSRVRNWTKMVLLKPEGDAHPGGGRACVYSEEALLDAALLQMFHAAGINAVDAAEALKDARALGQRSPTTRRSLPCFSTP